MNHDLCLQGQSLRSHDIPHRISSTFAYRDILSRFKNILGHAMTLGKLV